MYCGAGALFPHEYPWASKLLKVRHSSQRVPVRIHGRVPRIDFFFFVFKILRSTQNHFCCFCSFYDKVNWMQSLVLC